MNDTPAAAPVKRSLILERFFDPSFTPPPKRPTGRPPRQSIDEFRLQHPVSAARALERAAARWVIAKVNNDPTADDPRTAQMPFNRQAGRRAA